MKNFMLVITIFFVSITLFTTDAFSLTDGFDFPIGNRIDTSGWKVTLDFKKRNSKYPAPYNIHIAEDWVKVSGDCTGSPVYAVANGTITKMGSVSSSADKGKYIVIRHDTPEGYIYSVYLHIHPIVGYEDVRRGEQIGTIYKYATSIPHLHFEIRNFMQGNGSGTLYPKGRNGYYRSMADIDADGFLDPTDYISSHRSSGDGSGVGQYEDGWHTDTSPAFVAAYIANGGQSKLGVPDSSPGETPYVHTWGPLLIQDFTGGEYGDSAIIYNPKHNMAYVVRTAFWNAFKNLDGYCRDYFLRRPTSDEYKPDSGQAEGGNKVIAIQDFEFGHMEFYVDGCSNPGGCVDMYSNTIDETVGYSDDVKPPSLHCPMLLTESMSYRPQSYTVTAQIRKELLALHDGSIFELAWSMECGNDLIRLAGTYSDNDWGWQFSYDATDDGAGGNEAFETYRLATTFDAEYMYVELTTNYPIQGVMSEYGLGLLSPGDLYINVGGSLLENTGTLFGFALTSHSGDMTGNADPYDDIYTWDAVQQGHLYADVTFATGTFEEYAGANDWFEDGGDDPFGRANNIPTLIAQWGQDLGYQGDVTWEKPVPEPSTVFLLGSGLVGVLSLVRKRFKK